MEKFLQAIFKALGSFGGSGTTASWILFLDEAEAPKSLIEK